MLTGVDSSILLDVLRDTPQGPASAAALDRAAADGGLIVCECVLVEIAPALPARDIEEMLADWEIRFVPSSVESARLAGRWFAEYLRQGGPRGRIVADFLIAAHAKVHADRLLTRDLGFRRGYFSEVTVWEP